MKDSFDFLIIVVSGPSGAGKNSVLNILPEEKFYFSVSHTTRKPRPNEIHGKDYYFVSKEEFENMIKNNELLEWAKVYDYYYGTSKKEIEKAFSQNKHIVFNIEVNGATRLRSYFKNQAVFIFIAPPSLKEIENRLLKRGTENKEELEKRIKRAKEELKFIPWFDYVIVNKDLETSRRLLKHIISAELCKPFRVKEISTILDEVL